MSPVRKRSSLALAAAAIVISGCDASTVVSGPTARIATSAPMQTPTPTPVPTRSLAPGATATPSPTPLPSAVATFPTYPTASPKPTVSPTLAPGQTPSPAPTSAPALYHPAANGDQFSFAGSEVVTFSRPNQYPTPEPTTTADYTIAQTVTVKNPATFGSVTNAIDFSSSETDTETTGPSTSPIGDVIDTYYAFSNTSYTGDFYTLGFTSADSNDFAVVLSYPNAGSLTDILPEAAGATWNNVATQQINTQNSSGDTSQQNYASDGTYTEDLNFPSDGPQANGSPQPAATSSIVQKIDGSGRYLAQRNGNARTGDTSYSFSAPSASTNLITVSVITQPLTSASPGATPVATSTTAPDWIPTGYLNKNLYTESDVDNGSKTIPASCNVPASFGTTANQIVQTRDRVDTVLGEFETYAFTYYDMLSVGPVCTILHDVTTNYYDYTGQTYPGYFAGLPLEVTTIDETLALSSEQLESVARHPETRAIQSHAFAMRSGALASRVAVLQARRRFAITHGMHAGVVRRLRNVAQKGTSR